MDRDDQLIQYLKEQGYSVSKKDEEGPVPKDSNAAYAVCMDCGHPIFSPEELRMCEDTPYWKCPICGAMSDAPQKVFLINSDWRGY